MGKKNIELSPALYTHMMDTASEEQLVKIYSMFQKHNLIEYLYQYVIDSKFRIAVKLHSWLKSQVGNPLIQQIASECIGDTYDATIQNILRYWYNTLTYDDDTSTYGKSEYWATAEEILALGKDDCDGYMDVIYLTALEAGIPEHRMKCTIGWVSNQGKQVGHAYVTYIADNLAMYAIDGTFYPKESMRFEKQYFDNPRYYYGLQEWARFDTKNTYRLK